MAVKTYDGKVLFEGCVLRTWEHSDSWDSDFYADCVNVEDGTIETMEYDTTRFPGCGHAEVDITAENYRQYLKKAHERLLRESIGFDRAKASKIEEGKEVVVVRGRKVPKGTKGVIFWLREANYDPYNRYWGQTTRIGIRDEEGNVYWTYDSNVEVLNPKRYYTPIKTLNKQLKQRKSKEYKKLWRTNT